MQVRVIVIMYQCMYMIIAYNYEVSDLVRMNCEGDIHILLTIQLCHSLACIYFFFVYNL